MFASVRLQSGAIVPHTHSASRRQEWGVWRCVWWARSVRPSTELRRRLRGAPPEPPEMEQTSNISIILFKACFVFLHQNKMPNLLHTHSECPKHLCQVLNLPTNKADLCLSSYQSPDKTVEPNGSRPHLSVVNILHSCVFFHGCFLINVKADLLKSCQATGEQLCPKTSKENIWKPFRH